MGDPKHDAMRRERASELEKLLANTSRLTSDEYISLLEEIKKNYTILLAVKSVQGRTENTGGMINIIEKVHNLIDSCKSPADVSSDKTIIIKFEHELPEVLPDNAD